MDALTTGTLHLRGEQIPVGLILATSPTAFVVGDGSKTYTIQLKEVCLVDRNLELQAYGRLWRELTTAKHLVINNVVDCGDVLIADVLVQGIRLRDKLMTYLHICENCLLDNDHFRHHDH